MECLLDLRLADDIFWFAATKEELAMFLGALVEELAGVGLLLNPAKTVVLTNQARSPEKLFTQKGVSFKLLPPEEGQRWLGCMLTRFCRPGCRSYISLTASDESFLGQQTRSSSRSSSWS